MAIRDFEIPTETKDAIETQFIDQLLEGWAKWAHNTGVDQRPTAAGDLWQIQAIIEMGTYVIELMDDNFVLIDQKIAHLPRRLHAVVFVEYMHDLPGREKAKSMGLSHLAYRQRLHAAQWSLYTTLMPYLDALRQNTNVNAVKKAVDRRRKTLA